MNKSTGVSMCYGLDGLRHNYRADWIVEIQWPDGLGSLIEAGATDWELKDQEGTGYDREELREHAIARWSEYLV